MQFTIPVHCNFKKQVPLEFISFIFHGFRHPRMGDDAANPFILPIFDTNYTVDLVWPPSDTFDVAALKKVSIYKLT